MQSGEHILSLSLGGISEPSGLAVIEPRSIYWYPGGREDELDWENQFEVIWLERFEPGRPVPAIVARVRELLSEKRLARGHSLLLDITASGAAAVRTIERHGLYPRPTEITKAGAAEYQNGAQKIPLLDVIGAAQIALQTQRLKVASGLELAGVPETAADLVGDVTSDVVDNALGGAPSGTQSQGCSC